MPGNVPVRDHNPAEDQQELQMGKRFLPWYRQSVSWYFYFINYTVCQAVLLLGINNLPRTNKN